MNGKTVLEHAGILDVEIIPDFWPELDDRLRRQVLGLMLQVGVCQCLCPCDQS